MKNSVLMLFAVFTAVIFSSCSDEAVAVGNESLDSSANLKGYKSAPLIVDVQLLTVHLEDADGNFPVGDDTPLYNKKGGQHVPLMTPDGSHQVTLGEFKMISGTASVKCINPGTHVVLHLKGLIPNGVYTIWTVTFESPGNQIGFGALGAIEGNQNSNSFKADSDGVASISVIRPTGNLLTDGSVNPFPNYIVPNCLGDVYETHLALAYHLNNIPTAPGAHPTWLVQGVFQFWGSQL